MTEIADKDLWSMASLYSWNTLNAFTNEMAGSEWMVWTVPSLVTISKITAINLQSSEGFKPEKEFGLKDLNVGGTLNICSIDNRVLMWQQPIEDVTWPRQRFKSHYSSEMNMKILLSTTCKIKRWAYLCSVSLHPRGLKGNVSMLHVFPHRLAVAQGEKWEKQQTWRKRRRFPCSWLVFTSECWREMK